MIRTVIFYHAEEQLVIILPKVEHNIFEAFARAIWRYQDLKSQGSYGHWNINACHKVEFMPESAPYKESVPTPHDEDFYKPMGEIS